MSCGLLIRRQRMKPRRELPQSSVRLHGTCFDCTAQLMHATTSSIDTGLVLISELSACMASAFFCDIPGVPVEELLEANRGPAHTLKGILANSLLQGGTILMDPRCPISPGIPMGKRLLSVFGRHPESAAYAVLRHNGCVCSEPIVDSRCLSVLCAILNRPQYHTKTCRNWDYVKGSDVAKQLPEALKAFEEANPAQAHFDEAIKAQLIDDGANAGLSRAAAREKEARRKLWRICHTRQWTGLFNSPEGTVRMQRYTSAGMPEFDTVVTCLDKGKLVPAHLWKCKTELSMACMYS